MQIKFEEYMPLGYRESCESPRSIPENACSLLTTPELSRVLALYIGDKILGKSSVVLLIGVLHSAIQITDSVSSARGLQAYCGTWATSFWSVTRSGPCQLPYFGCAASSIFKAETARGGDQDHTAFTESQRNLC